MMQETVDCETPNLYAKSSSSSPRRSLTKTRKNSSIGGNVRLRPVFDFIEDSSVTRELDQYLKWLIEGPR